MAEAAYVILDMSNTVNANNCALLSLAISIAYFAAFIEWSEPAIAAIVEPISVVR